MRAHFAGDDDDDVLAVTCESFESKDAAGHVGLDDIKTDETDEVLVARIGEFKQDSKNMEAVNEFIDDVLQKAEVEAVKKQSDSTTDGIVNGSADEGVGKLKKAKQHVKKMTISAIKKLFEWQDSKEGKEAPSSKNSKKSLEETHSQTLPDAAAASASAAQPPLDAASARHTAEVVQQQSTAAAQDIQEETQEAQETQELQPKDEQKQNQNLKNGKVVNRARGLVVRIFDAICNCTNTATTPAQRIKLHAKRATSSVTATTDCDAGDEATGEEKQSNGKEQQQDEAVSKRGAEEQQQLLQDKKQIAAEADKK